MKAISSLDLTTYLLKGVVDSCYWLGNPIFGLNRPKARSGIRRVSYGTEANQQMDVISPCSQETTHLPILVYFLGGGCISDEKKNYRGICHKLASNGFLIFNVNYRLAPSKKFPTQLQDVACALKWIVEHAEKYGGDSSRIFLAGDSAGAQLASWYATALQKEELFEQAEIDAIIEKETVRGLLLFYGVYDFDFLMESRSPFIGLYAKSVLGDDIHTRNRYSWLASPMNHTSANLPPVFLCAGERDNLFEQTARYADVLESKGVNCTPLLFSKSDAAQHGFLYFGWLKATRIAFHHAGRFLTHVAQPARYPTTLSTDDP